jgi:muconolactone delta-isomerase
MLFMFHGRLEKPDGMSNEEFYGLWEEESEAAVELLGAGTIKWAYKVAGQPEIVSLIDVPDNGGIDGFLQSLPIYRKGYSHLVKDLRWFPLREYADWYAELKELAHPK